MHSRIQQRPAFLDVAVDQIICVSCSVSDAATSFPATVYAQRLDIIYHLAAPHPTNPCSAQLLTASPAFHALTPKTITTLTLASSAGIKRLPGVPAASLGGSKETNTPAVPSHPPTPSTAWLPSAWILCARTTPRINVSAGHSQANHSCGLNQQHQQCISQEGYITRPCSKIEGDVAAH